MLPVRIYQKNHVPSQHLAPSGFWPPQFDGMQLRCPADRLLTVNPRTLHLAEMSSRAPSGSTIGAPWPILRRISPLRPPVSGFGWASFIPLEEKRDLYFDQYRHAQEKAELLTTRAEQRTGRERRGRRGDQGGQGAVQCRAGRCAGWAVPDLDSNQS